MITPPLGEITVTDFGRSAESMDIGEAATRALAEKLRGLSVSEEEWAAWVKRHRRPPFVPPVIQKIEVESQGTRLSDDVIRANMRTRAGEVLSLDRLQNDLERIYGLEEFEAVVFTLEEREDGTYLVLHVRGKPWGPGYVRFGLALSDDLDGESEYTFGLQYTLREINSLGAEWRNEFGIGENGLVRSEFYQPLDYAGRYFVAPQIRYRRVSPNVFQSGSQVAEVRVEEWQMRLDVGRQLSNWGELRFGIGREWGDVDPIVTSVPFQGFDYDDAGVFAKFSYDTLDDVNFPGDGEFCAAANFLLANTSATHDEIARFV